MFIKGRCIRQQQKRTTQEPKGKEIAKPEVQYLDLPIPTVPVSVVSFVELPVHFFPCHHFIAASRSADRTPVTVKENK